MKTRPLMLAIATTFALTNAFADVPPAAQKPAVAEPAKPAAKAPTYCSGSGSGTHVRQKAPNCASTAPMRSYGQQDLERTGETDLGQALKKLDPIFR
jgi:hypothetical protein